MQTNANVKIRKRNIVIVSVTVVLLVGLLLCAVLIPVLLQPGAAVVSATPSPPTTVSFVPVANPVRVRITTTINAEVVCLAFDQTNTLQYGNCGDPAIQGTWDFDDVFFTLTNSVLRSSQTSCMINPTNPSNPTIKGQPTISSMDNCEGLDISGNRISATLDSGEVNYVSVISGRLAWTQDPSFAQVFHFA